MHDEFLSDFRIHRYLILFRSYTSETISWSSFADFPPFGFCVNIHALVTAIHMLKQSFATLSFNIVEILHAKVNRRYFSFNLQIYIYWWKKMEKKKKKNGKKKKKKKKKNRFFFFFFFLIGRIRMEIVRSGVGVNYREPPDEIGRVGISVITYDNYNEHCPYLFTNVSRVARDTGWAWWTLKWSSTKKINISCTS